jgi:hypothetical protein
MISVAFVKPVTMEQRKLIDDTFEMAIQALSQVSEIEKNIIKYMKKYPNHVGNTDFWEDFYACRNVVLQLDDEEYAPKEQEPCELLIIKSDILLHQDDRKKWMESIKREKESGVIILPPYFEPLLVPANIEINIEQEPKWIPVSERLPEDDGLYLVYTEEQPFVCPFKNGEFFIDEVLEWMPLPAEPYEPQERSE